MPHPQTATTERCWGSVAHRLVAPDGVEEGRVVLVADLRQNEGQEVNAAVQLGVHEELKVEQVSNDVDGCNRATISNRATLS